MLSLEQKLAIVEVWSALRPMGTKEDQYPLVVDMIAAQVELIISTPEEKKRPPTLVEELANSGEMANH